MDGVFGTDTSFFDIWIIERNRLSITAAASLLAVDPSQGPKAPQLLYSISSLVPRTD